MSDFEIRPLHTLDEFHAAEELQRAAWGSADIDIAPLHVMLTIAKNGGVVLGAFAADQLIGFVYGFVGMTDRADAQVETHLASNGRAAGMAKPRRGLCAQSGAA